MTPSRRIARSHLLRVGMLLAAAAGACGDTTGLEGTWSGNIPDVGTITMRLKETSQGLRGDGMYNGARVQFAITVTGTETPDSLYLRLHPADALRTDAVYRGARIDDTHIGGKVEMELADWGAGYGLWTYYMGLVRAP